MARIAVDAMGGDHAPDAVVAGAVDAFHRGNDVVLVGDPARITPLLERSDADFVKLHTGFSIGGVSPFGHPAPLSIWLDQDLHNFDTVWAAAGNPRSVFEITAADLERTTAATRIDVT